MVAFEDYINELLKNQNLEDIFFVEEIENERKKCHEKESRK